MASRDGSPARPRLTTLAEAGVRERPRRRWVSRPTALVMAAMLGGVLVGALLDKLYQDTRQTLDVHAPDRSSAVVLTTGKARAKRRAANTTRLPRPLGCPEVEAAACGGQDSEQGCLASPCCAWSTDEECLAIDFREQLWLGFSSHHAGYTNQYMTYLKDLAVVENMVTLLSPRWDLCVVLPRVLRSVGGLATPALTPIRREDEELGDTVPGPWSHLFSVGATAGYLQGVWKAAEGKAGRPRRLIIFENQPEAVALPTVYAGMVTGRGDWSGVNPTLHEWHYLGEEWVPDADLQSCEGGGYKAMVGNRGMAPPLNRVSQTPDYFTLEDVARRVAAKLPGRAMAGEGALVHSLFICGAVFQERLLTKARVHALAPGPFVQSMAEPVIAALRRMSVDNGGDGSYGAMHVRLEDDWVQACHKSNYPCAGYQSLPEVTRCLHHFDFKATVVYVATGNDVIMRDEFKAWRASMKRHGFVVATKNEVDPAFAKPVVGDGTYGPMGREELAAMESAIVSRAQWFLGWCWGTTFSWVNVYRLRVFSDDATRGMFFVDECPGMDHEQFLLFRSAAGPPPRQAPLAATLARVAVAVWAAAAALQVSLTTM